MKWEDCKKCPMSACESGIYDKRIDPTTGNVISYKIGNILKTREVSIRPICLLQDHFRVDFSEDGFGYWFQETVNLLEALIFIIDEVAMPLESMLYYMKIKNEIENA